MSNNRLKVVMVDPLSPEQLVFLQGIADDFQLELSAPQNEDRDSLIKLLKDADAVVVQRRVFWRRVDAGSSAPEDDPEDGRTTRPH